MSVNWTIKFYMPLIPGEHNGKIYKRSSWGEVWVSTQFLKMQCFTMKHLPRVNIFLPLKNNLGGKAGQRAAMGEKRDNCN